MHRRPNSPGYFLTDPYLQGWNNAAARILDCRIEQNSAGTGGGAFFFKLGASPTILRTIISNNSAQSGNGGGICAWDSSATIVNTIVAGNTSPGTAGMFYHNCTTQITNSTITANTAGCLEANGKNHVLLNSICWGNGGKEFVFTGGAIAASYSDIQGSYAGTGNINADPVFKGASDFHLTPVSPCREKGSLAGAPLDDVDGEPRPQGNNVDIGADEAPE